MTREIPKDFQGDARPRTDDIIPTVAKSLGVEVAALQALIEVETNGSGFDRKGRPKMLFEPHIFYGLVGTQKRRAAVEAKLAYPVWRKAYPKDSYDRLTKAMKIDRIPALRSASWGLGQILGTNIAEAAAENFVAEACESEDNQIRHIANFIRGRPSLLAALKRRDWPSVARQYNGPGYKKNAYDTKLAVAYKKHRKPVVKQPDTSTEDIRSIQKRLKERGYHIVGKVDGVWGKNTTAAISAFQHEMELPVTGKVDSATREMLFGESDKAPVSDARAEAKTVEGSRTVAVADTMKWVGGALGTGGVAAEVLDKVESAKDVTERSVPLLQAVKEIIVAHPFATVAVLAFVAVGVGVAVKYFRVSDHREGKLA